MMRIMMVVSHHHHHLTFFMSVSERINTIISHQREHKHSFSSAVAFFPVRPFLTNRGQHSKHENGKTAEVFSDNPWEKRQSEAERA